VAVQKRLDQAAAPRSGGGSFSFGGGGSVGGGGSIGGGSSTGGSGGKGFLSSLFGRGKSADDRAAGAAGHAEAGDGGSGPWQGGCGGEGEGALSVGGAMRWQGYGGAGRCGSPLRSPVL
jgi:hypothetical protein